MFLQNQVCWRSISLNLQRKLPAWQDSLCQTLGCGFSPFVRFQARACQAGRYFNRFWCITSPHFRICKNIFLPGAIAFARCQMVIFAYFGNLKPRPARQENILTDSSVLLVHNSESAKTFSCPGRLPLPDVKWCVCLFWQFTAKACQAGGYFYGFQCSNSPRFRICKNIFL
jgi:hypothetical protein